MKQFTLTPHTITLKYKAKRVAKYFVVLLIFYITCHVIDAIVNIWIADAWLTFESDWLVLYGAMSYRLVSTWNYSK